jgi:hypothetical protein
MQVWRPIARVASWRLAGVSFREIGWRLAMSHGRPVAFTWPSVQTAYARWPDAQGIQPNAESVDLRHRRKRT